MTSLFQKNKIKAIIEQNRKILTTIDEWIDDDIYENSIFQYGLPRHVKHLINNEIGREITYSDAILYLSRFLDKKINYLELGVSVGKNFLQVVNFLQASTITGFDIEEINPVLEIFFDNKTIWEEWETEEKSMKKGKSSLKRYTFNSNEVNYISGDIFDESSWKRLYGHKFNLIFSDAFHSADAVLYEYQMLKKYHLLDEDEFILVWDDLGGEMTKSFMQISADLSLQHKLSEDRTLIIPLRGWLGINEHKHEVGIVMKIKNYKQKQL